MRPTTTVAAASAAVLCLGALLTGCGSAAGSPYAAVGAAGPADRTAPVPPRGGVELTPLDGNGSPGPSGTPDGSGATTGSPTGRGRTPDSGGPDGSSGSAAGPSAPGHSGSPSTNHPSPPGGSDTPGGPGGPGGDHPRPGGSPAPTPPSPTLPAGPGAPAGLVVGKPVLAAADVRWCQRVTLDFLNTGDRPVTTGTVTFGSHVIGALGVDWATYPSTHHLPLPLAPGKPATGTWRVCVDAWRVPLGMHLETRDVRFDWGGGK